MKSRTSSKNQLSPSVNEQKGNEGKQPDIPDLPTKNNSNYAYH